VKGVKKERLYQIEGQPPSIDQRPEGCPFWPRCPFAMDICREKYPPQTSTGGDDYVHCWLAAQ
jgi:oligopeptide/dipeptide ABC transporter ATP-binding protein